MSRFRTPEEIQYFLRSGDNLPCYIDEASEDEDMCEDEHHTASEQDCDESTSSENENMEADEELEEPAAAAPSRRPKYIIGKDGYKWSKQGPETRSRRRKNDLRVHFPCPLAEARNITIPLDAWNLLISNEMLETIVQWTNEQIHRCVHNMPQETRNYAWTTEVDFDEVKAFIGLLYFAGVEQRGKSSVEDLFSTAYGNYFYSSVMSIKRFKFIASNLRFDDKETREERRESDWFAPIRDLWETFNTNCKTYYSPSNSLTIDEQLLGFHGKFGARVYIKSKPARYGIKIVSMNDAKTYYMYNAIPYAGQVTPARGEKIPEYYVRTLSEPIHDTGRVVAFDNWFTTVTICDKMRNEYGLHAIGTVRKNKRELPISFVKPQAVGSTRYVFDNQKGLTLLSYCPKRNKIVLVLSTIPNQTGVVKNSDKPKMIEMYNKTKSGVDTFDKMVGMYSTARQTNRWPMRVFFGILDQAGVNATILHNLITANDNLLV